MVGKGEMGREIEALRENMLFWDKYPCGLPHAEKMKETLHKLRQERYAQYFWPKPIVEFEKWNGKEVLEIGCGIGLDSSMFSECGAEVVCLDLSRKSLQAAKQIVSGDFVCTSACTIEKLLRRKFDLVYTFGVLHHIPEAQEVVDQIYAVLKDGGEVIAMLYNRNSITYWKMILIEGLFKRAFFEGKTVEELLRYAERGASEHLKPYVTCYSVRKLRKLFSKFRNLRIEIHALSPFDVPFLKMPDNLARFLESKVGWFLVLKGYK